DDRDLHSFPTRRSSDLVSTSLDRRSHCFRATSSTTEGRPEYCTPVITSLTALQYSVATKPGDGASSFRQSQWVSTRSCDLVPQSRRLLDMAAPTRLISSGTGPTCRA